MILRWNRAIEIAAFLSMNSPAEECIWTTVVIVKILYVIANRSSKAILKLFQVLIVYLTRNCFHYQIRCVSFMTSASIILFYERWCDKNEILYLLMLRDCSKIMLSLNIAQMDWGYIKVYLLSIFFHNETITLTCIFNVSQLLRRIKIKCVLQICLTNQN